MSDLDTQSVGSYKYVAPGKGEVTVEGFILLRNAKEPKIGINIKIMRKTASGEKPLKYWPDEGNLDEDGFIFIPIKRLHQERRSLTINLDKYVIDPIAWAVSEEFVLRIKGKDYPSGADKQFVYEFGVANSSQDRCAVASSSVLLKKKRSLLLCSMKPVLRLSLLSLPCSGRCSSSATRG